MGNAASFLASFSSIAFRQSGLSGSRAFRRPAFSTVPKMGTVATQIQLLPFGNSSSIVFSNGLIEGSLFFTAAQTSSCFTPK